MPEMQFSQLQECNAQVSWPALEAALAQWHEGNQQGDPAPITEALLAGLREGADILLPFTCEDETLIVGQTEIQFGTIHNSDGIAYFPAFTNLAEADRGTEASMMPQTLAQVLDWAAWGVEDCQGVVINPWGSSLVLERQQCIGLLKAIRPKTEDEVSLDAGAELYNQGNYNAAFPFYQKAAELGNAIALSNLGYCYYYGHGCGADKEKAVSCWRLAAAQGDICAIYKLGDVFRNGDLETNLPLSRKLYRRAFDLAMVSKDINAYPDAFLRMLKYHQEDLIADYIPPELVAKACAEGFEKRVANGDTAAAKMLAEAQEILIALGGNL